MRRSFTHFVLIFLVRFEVLVRCQEGKNAIDGTGSPSQAEVAGQAIIEENQAGAEAAAASEQAAKVEEAADVAADTAAVENAVAETSDDSLPADQASADSSVVEEQVSAENAVVNDAATADAAAAADEAAADTSAVEDEVSEETATASAGEGDMTDTSAAEEAASDGSAAMEKANQASADTSGEEGEVHTEASDDSAGATDAAATSDALGEVSAEAAAGASGPTGETDQTAASALAEAGAANAEESRPQNTSAAETDAKADQAVEPAAEKPALRGTAKAAATSDASVAVGAVENETVAAPAALDEATADVGTVVAEQSAAASETDKAPLQNIGKDVCNATAPCGQCQGDCDNDNECAEGLRCFERDTSDQLVPGCTRGGDGDVPTHDYCYKPSFDYFDDEFADDKFGYDGFYGGPTEPTPTNYTRLAMSCVKASNIILHRNQSVAACAELCNADVSCHAFEYGVTYGGGGASYKPKDCQLQSSNDASGCAGAYDNLDLYVKGELNYTYQHTLSWGELYGGNYSDYMWDEAGMSLTSEQLGDVHKRMDKDHDGKLTLEEVMAFSDEMTKRSAVKDVPYIMESMDANHDGNLEMNEFLRDVDKPDNETLKKFGAEVVQDMEAENELQKAKFLAADENGDGILEKEELPALWHPETADKSLLFMAQSTIRERDLDGDGKLNVTELWHHGREYFDFGIDVNDTISEDERLDFRSLDKDHDGLLDSTELKEWESGRFRTEQDMKELFKIADKDGDGLVSKEELDAAKEKISHSQAQMHLIEWAQDHELRLL